MSESSRNMRIGELAARGRVRCPAVRFYERTGILEEPPREPSGYRRYDTRHLTRLSFIRHCRSLDIPLPEVRQLLDFAARPQPACAQVDALIDGHIQLVKQRIKALIALEKQLLALRLSCDGDTSHPCAVLDPS